MKKVMHDVLRVWGAAQAIMKTLLGYIGKDKHADSLVEKLMLRFETAAKPAQWRNLAFCLTQVPLNLSSPVNSTNDSCLRLLRAT